MTVSSSAPLPIESSPHGVSFIVRKAAAAAIPLAALGLVWITAPPSGLEAPAWRMFGVFAATILGLLLQPLPSGALMVVMIAFTILARVLPEAKALAGFSNTTVWLIFCAYVISTGFLNTGFGRRIAYRMISWLGGSTLGIAYALGVTDLVFAPATPSVTARSGGVILPIVRSINATFQSEPGPSGKKLGDFLIITCFLITPVTGSMFMTGMAANPLVADLAKKTLNLEISWGGWALAALVPGVVSFILTPLLLYWLTKPEVKRTEGARELGRKALEEMGPMTSKEWGLVVVFALALLGWCTGSLTGLSASAVAICGVALLFLLGVVGWKEVLGQWAAWDTLIWFGAILGLAAGLVDLGFVKWMGAQLSTAFPGWSWVAAFVGLGLVYIYVHYAFATASGHVAALYPPFVLAAVAAGAPPMLVAITFGIFSNLMWGLTEYAGGPGPIYFGQGYFQRPRFYYLNLVVTTMNVAITFTVGLAWWKMIGLW